MSRIGHPRNLTKAVVRAETRDGRDVIVKDYRPRPWLVRALLGRRMLAREFQAYRRLQGLAGIADCLGFEGRDALVLARLPGRSLSDGSLETVPPESWTRLDALLGQVHARGVAIADLHRSNVLLAPDGSVSIVDFSLALCGHPERAGPLFRAAARLDRHAVARMKARALGEPEPTLSGALGAATRCGSAIKRLIRAFRRFAMS